MAADEQEAAGDATLPPVEDWGAAEWRWALNQYGSQKKIDLEARAKHLYGGHGTRGGTAIHERFLDDLATFLPPRRGGGSTQDKREQFDAVSSVMRRMGRKGGTVDDLLERLARLEAKLETKNPNVSGPRAATGSPEK
ncbi:unnamed protein product, partial [Amoebophrya sp. A25]|eukprot:GSA25T00011619001.1